MNVSEVLLGYFESSRYITKHVHAKYGLDPSLYDDSKKVNILRKRLHELLRENFKEPVTGDELRAMLGREFDWVKTSLDNAGMTHNVAFKSSK